MLTRILTTVLFAIFSLSIVAISPPPPTQVQPEGHLLLVGGGRTPDTVRQEFFKLSHGGPIVVIPTALKNPELARFDYPHTILHTTNRKECFHADFYKALDQAKGVWICGGDQSRLTIYSGTPVQYHLKNVVNRGGVVGGTSAGASAASGVMMHEGDALNGLGLMNDYVVDQHFSNRDRLPRLLNLLEKHPNLKGIGIDEETAIIVGQRHIVVVGNGNVKVCNHGIIFTYHDGDVIER
jgi:cyanophycinase